MPQSHWPLSIFSWFGHRLPLRERLALIAEAGFEAVTLWWGDEEFAAYEEKQAAPALVRAFGLHLENIHLPYQAVNGFWAREAVERDRTVALHLGWLEECARHGVPLVVMHASEGVHPPGPGDAGVDAIARVVARAEQLGLTIALENTIYPDHLNTVLAEILSPNLGLCFDSCHDALWSERPLWLLRKWSHRLLALHLSDHDGHGKKHILPGTGRIDWPLLADSLPLDTYSGWISFEVFPEAGSRPEEARQFLAKAHDRAQWFVSMLAAKVLRAEA